MLRKKQIIIIIIINKRPRWRSNTISLYYYGKRTLLFTHGGAGTQGNEITFTRVPLIIPATC